MGLKLAYDCAKCTKKYQKHCEKISDKNIEKL